MLVSRGEIIDPYGGTIAVYERTYKELEEVMTLVIRKLKERWKCVIIYNTCDVFFFIN